MRRRWFVLMAALLSIAFAPAPFPKPARKPPGATIVGTWGNKNDDSFRVVVTATSLHYRDPNRAPRAPYQLTFDATANPKTYSLSLGGRPAYAGIYRIDGGVLILHYRPAHRPPPASFDDGDAYREVYVRARD
jgi:uncharacterized protein (TIGR03067 family)